MMRCAIRAASSAAPTKKADAGFPRYLIALAGAAGGAGLCVVGVLVLTHERGIREYAEEKMPWLVQLVRERVGFADEDQAERAYRERLKKE